MTPRLPLHIVGQGLAGTALAWRCLERGVPFRIYDSERSVTASKIAAGLVTPIAGQRLALTQGWSFLSEMTAFYAAIGSRLGKRVYETRELVRFLTSPLEQERWERRLNDTRYLDECLPNHSSNDSLKGFSYPYGYFRMRRAGFLDARAWLELSRNGFASEGHYTKASYSPESCPTNDGLWIFADGPWLLQHDVFDWLPMRYAHGDILTLTIPDLEGEDRLFNGRCWLMPSGEEGLWRAGATYEARPTPETSPSQQGRESIETQLRSFLSLPYQIVDHCAAVRPVTQTRFPTMGVHPARAHLAWFGGFGSKGVLSAPSYASRFLDHLLEGRPLPSEVDAID